MAFTVSGHVYDVDGSTVVTSGSVYIENFTKGTQMSVDIQSDGSYSADLDNLPSGWSAGDVIYVYVKKYYKHAVVRAIIGDSDTSWSLDIYLKTGPIHEASCKLKKILASCGSAATINFVDKANDFLVTAVNVAANGTVTADLGEGMYCEGGLRILIAGQGTTIQNQAAGVANAIGDNSNNAANVVSVDVAWR